MDHTVEYWHRTTVTDCWLHNGCLMLAWTEEKCIRLVSPLPNTPSTLSAPGRSGKSTWLQIFHIKQHTLPQRVCFILQVLFSGLLDNVEKTWPFTETQLTSNGRSCFTRTKETKMDWVDLIPGKIMSVFNTFYFNYNTVALSRAERN